MYIGYAYYLQTLAVEQLGEFCLFSQANTAMMLLDLTRSGFPAC